MRATVFMSLMFIVALGCAGPTAEKRGADMAGQTGDPSQAAGAQADNEEPRRRLVGIDGLRLSILEAGTGQPVIFVHGVVTTSNIFPKYLSAYSPDYRGIAVDLRGYGESDKPASGFTIDHFVSDLIKLADQLGAEKPVWVGVSMGGMILQRLALDHPSRIGALVLVSTTDGAMILADHLETIGAPRDYHAVSKTIIEESFPPGTDPTLYQPMLQRIPTWNGTVLREALQSMAKFNVHGQLSRIQAPTVVMVGAKDPVATVEIAKGIAEQIPGAQLVVFKTGHFIMAEDPEAFRVELGKFLRGLKSDGRNERANRLRQDGDSPGHLRKIVEGRIKE